MYEYLSTVQGRLSTEARINILIGLCLPNDLYPK